MGTIIISGIEIEVIQKKIKNIHLTVHPPEGRVRLSVPKKMSEEASRLLIQSKLEWIQKHRSRMALLEKPVAANFLSGENHFFMGNAYSLNLIETSGRQGLTLRDEKTIDLYVRPGHTKEKREKVLNDWYRKELKNRIPLYIEKWEKIIGVTVNEWGVKRMKTKWGTCNITARRIWINLELAKKPPRCLDYIVVHEMVHLLERYHNERFKSYMNQFLPDWKTIQGELNNLEDKRI